jgi:hypothetical protein
MDTTFFIQFAAVALFAVCLFYAWRAEGPRLAQQWFLIGYLFAVLIASLLVVIQQLAFNANMVVFGAAPSLTVMLFPALFYAAYALAGRYVEVTNLRAMGYLMFVLTPWLFLPLDALAISQRWWWFPSESFAFLNGIPFYIPFAWGVTGAAFFLMMGRIRQIRFRGNGQFFAMIIATPLLAALQVLLIAMVQVIIDTLAVFGGTVTLYVALALLFLLLPLALFFNVPKIADGKSRMADSK